MLTLLLATVSLLGTVSDGQKHPLAGVTVYVLQGEKTISSATTDQRGSFQFENLAPGEYSVRAESKGFSSRILNLKMDKDQKADITLEPAFFDEPQYQVAGVTDNSYRGGHGADTVLRSSESLTKDTAALSKQPPVPATYQALPYLYHLLGDSYEKRGKSLDAVHAYQRAVELEPTEPYIFDLGTELLTHLAPDAAGETFAKGHDLFPNSVRMLLGSAVSLYAEGRYEQAAERFFQACDLNPTNPDPYLFLGKVQRAEITRAPGYLERLGRFAQLQPDNEWANYYYAVALWKQENDAVTAITLLKKAIKGKPDFALAYLQLGIVEADQKQLSEAREAYQQAIRLDPSLEEPHYRLAQSYKLSGEAQLAQREIQIYNQTSKQNALKLEQERSEVQRFVISVKLLRP